MKVQWDEKRRLSLPLSIEDDDNETQSLPILPLPTELPLSPLIQSIQPSLSPLPHELLQMEEIKIKKAKKKNKKTKKKAISKKDQYSIEEQKYALKTFFTTYSDSKKWEQGI